MVVLTDYEGRLVRLTDERWAHVEEHPEMAGMREALAECFVIPRLSRSRLAILW
jgi:hypothetical protein